MGALWAMVTGLLIGVVLGGGIGYVCGLDKRDERRNKTLAELAEYRTKAARTAKRVAERNAGQMFGSLDGWRR